jgi:hypothetical protein
MKQHAMLTKQERMEIRKAIGNRKITPPPPRPRGPEYLSHFACFDCRKSFKQDPLDESLSHTCPDCTEALHDMGRNFRPPKKTDKKSWEVARRLYDAGFRFFGSGSHTDPDLPTSLREVDQFILDNPDHYLRVKR